MSDDGPAWDRDGACLHRSAAVAWLDRLLPLFGERGMVRGGVRVAGDAVLRSVAQGPLRDLASVHLGPRAMPVRAILFDKHPHANWSLGWHQDRTIAVRDRRDMAGFGPWTVKQGLLHVAPPFPVIAGMATPRVHLDDVPEDNAPLLIAPGTHRIGRVAEDAIPAAVDAHGVRMCLARAGDVWAHATPILHASHRSAGERRRVLQVDYSAADLPGDLEWLGV